LLRRRWRRGIHRGWTWITPWHNSLSLRSSSPTSGLSCKERPRCSTSLATLSARPSGAGAIRLRRLCARCAACLGTSRCAEAGSGAVRRVPVLALEATDDQLVRQRADDSHRASGRLAPQHCGHMLPIGRAAENTADKSSISRTTGVSQWGNRPLPNRRRTSQRFRSL
jgi:hypothetical protein